MSLQLHLAQIPEFRRQNKNFRHFLVDILAIRVVATLCGADDFEEIALFEQQKEGLLRRYLPLPAGPPAVDTYRRVFEKLNFTRFNACFMAWMQEVLPADRAGQLCVDGKTLCGTGARPLHVVSAVASAWGQCLGQVAGQGKGQELGAVPELLALLDLRGALVSLDALSCQPHVAQQITNQGGDYLLGLKANQPTLLAEAERHTAALPASQPGAHALGLRQRRRAGALPGLDASGPALGGRARPLAGTANPDSGGNEPAPEAGTTRTHGTAALLHQQPGAHPGPGRRVCARPLGHRKRLALAT